LLNVVISISKHVKNHFIVTHVPHVGLFTSRWMGLKWMVFLLKPLDLMGVWFGEDQRSYIIRIHVLKRLDYIFKYKLLLYT
jgi:hypothetical protein